MHKTCPAKIKAAGSADGLADGQFRALVSVFGNVDSYGDVVHPGAFTNTLAEWAESGEQIPVYYSHQINDPAMNIGWVVEAKETADGLEVLGELDLSDDAPPTARYVHRLLKRPGGVRDFSFAYDVVDGAPGKDEDGNDVFDLHELKLYEVGPTQIGANPATELLGVKHLAEHATRMAAEFKAGRVLSARNEQTLKDALDALNGCATSIKNVLAAVASSDDEDGKTANPLTGLAIDNEQARDTGPVTSKDSPPPADTDKERSRRTPAKTLALLFDLTEGTTP